MNLGNCLLGSQHRIRRPQRRSGRSTALHPKIRLIQKSRRISTCLSSAVHTSNLDRRSQSCEKYISDSGKGYTHLYTYRSTWRRRFDADQSGHRSVHGFICDRERGVLTFGPSVPVKAVQDAPRIMPTTDAATDCLSDSPNSGPRTPSGITPT